MYPIATSIAVAVTIVGLGTLALAQTPVTSAATTAAAAKPTPIEPTAADPATPPGEMAAPAPAEDTAPVVPPPSTWDEQQQKKDAGHNEGEISWSAQLLKTFFALALVVGLIYALFKVGLARFIGVAAFKAGKTMKVLERIQLDGRHAVVIVELTEPHRRRLLLGTGERGVQLLTELDEQATSEKSRATFQHAMEQTAAPKNETATDDRGSHD